MMIRYIDFMVNLILISYKDSKRLTCVFSQAQVIFYKNNLKILPK